MSQNFCEKLCSVERDRVTAAEICMDELLTIMDRHNVDEPIYNMALNLSAYLQDMLSDAEATRQRRERLLRVRDALTAAFPLTDVDLGVANA